MSIETKDPSQPSQKLNTEHYSDPAESSSAPRTPFLKFPP